MSRLLYICKCYVLIKNVCVCFSCEVEDFQSIDSHILPETAIRRIRKRTISESDKGRLMSLEEAKRYKTG